MGVAAGAGDAADAQQRDTRLASEIMRDRGEALRARRLDRVPQVVGAGVGIFMLFHVAAQALSPHILAGVGFEHRDHRRSEEHTSELQSLMRISYAVV